MPSLNKTSRKKYVAIIGIIIFFLVVLRFMAYAVLNHERIVNIATVTRMPFMCTPLYYLDTLYIERVYDGFYDYECYKDVAIKLDKPKICDSAKFVRHECLKHFAVTRSDINYCSADSSVMSYQCYKALFEMGVIDVSDCENVPFNKGAFIPSWDYDACLYGSLNDNSDPEIICRKMKDSYHQDRCFDKFGLLE